MTEPATPTQLGGRVCVKCGSDFLPGQTGVVAGYVAGGKVYRHGQCPTRHTVLRRGRGGRA